MPGRRRPIAAFFATLLVWLTAVTAVRVAHPSETRLLGPEGDGAVTSSIAIPRSAILAIRAPSRSVVAPQPDLALLPARESLVPVVAEPRHATVLLVRVRQVHGTASTYDATAPPRLT
jgi:hypothetical protein